MKKPKLGKGANMSIAKAALKFYYEELEVIAGDDTPFLDYGQTENMNRIVAIAGAKHCDGFTPSLVTTRLAMSPYWESVLVSECYKDVRGHRRALFFYPSESGEKYYKEKLSGSL